MPATQSQPASRKQSSSWWSIPRARSGAHELPLVNLADHPLMKACRREAAPYTPVWLMRQAGRYMPEYREVREKFGFLALCTRPEVAAEVTVTAVRRLGVDAAIIFADILLPLIPMKLGLSYEAGGGPRIERRVASAEDVSALREIEPAESLSFVADAIRIVRRELPDRPLIGFAGAPFTLASYMIEGGSSRDYRLTKTFMYREPMAWDRLMGMLAKITGKYLQMQAAAGADLIQLFDSWVGALSPADYRRFVMPYSRAALAPLAGRIPTIHFGTGTAGLLEAMREAGGDVIGVDWRVNLREAWSRLGNGVAIQGNLDPMVLLAETAEIRRQVKIVLEQADGRPGHIFNLGHGILPQTPVDHAIALVDMVHELTSR
ncbi:MAG: uroporphyrinogen decarboxylase [Candidatus Binataceae bacterium]|nr:uroporphyrinogen decarboxylase [Candidatus Binataceae bacterium]